MSVLVIEQYGAEILRRKAVPVRRISKNTRKLLDDMAETMYAAQGVGLAAPQVGVGKRIVVIDVGDGLLELINPQITRLEGEDAVIEGCLSIPEYVGRVNRAAKVTVEALNRSGEPVWIEGEGLLAVALQHEIDHLEGVLFVDRAERVMANTSEDETPEE